MGWIIAAIIAIVFVQVMDLRDMVDTVKRIRKLEEEHDHLADKCGKAVMQVEKDLIKQRIENMGIREHAERVIESSDRIIKLADGVIEASHELNDTYKEFIELTKSQEEEAYDEETGQ